MSEEYLVRAPEAYLVVISNLNKTLLTIHPDGTVEAPSIEAASEAGRVFIEALRLRLSGQDRIAGLGAEAERLRAACDAAWEAEGKMKTKLDAAREVAKLYEAGLYFDRNCLSEVFDNALERLVEMMGEKEEPQA